MLSALAVVALVSTACSGTSGSSSDAGGAADALRQQGVRFAQCMRDTGITDFPDPGVSGGFTIDAIANGSSLDTDSPAFDRAMSACKDLEPAGFTGGERSTEQQQAALLFAQCIRDNGVQDFPDPVDGEPLVDTNKIPSTDRKGGMAILNAAMKTCSELGDEAIGKQK